MKKIVLLLSIPLMFFSSCKKDPQVLSNEENNLMTQTSLPDFEGVREFHNSLLQFLIDNVDIYPYINDSLIIDEIISNSLSFFYSQDEVCNVEQEESLINMYYAINNNFFSLDNGNLWSYISQTLEDELNQVDFYYFNQAQTIIEDALYEENELVDLILQMDKESNINTELISGYLHVLLHSNSFWKSSDYISSNTNSFIVSNDDNSYSDIVQKILLEILQ